MTRRAFTLIELLIVVGIIAILAAIAIPNFLEAQTRAKVSRMRADMRTVATALETYRIDWSAYPPTRGSIHETDPAHALDGWGRRCSRGFQTISLRLSTPVAHLTSATVVDIFKRGVHEGGWPYETGTPADAALVYQNVYALAVVDMEAGWVAADVEQRFGHWRLLSIGPDREYGCTCDSVYDPTNGTISYGNILRTQLDVEGRNSDSEDSES